MISKFLVIVIKYIGKVLCLWTGMNHKHNKHTDYICFYQVKVLSLS